MLILLPVTDYCLLESEDGENDRRNDFITNFHGSYAAKLGFELASPESEVGLATNCTVNTRYVGKYTYLCNDSMKSVNKNEMINGWRMRVEADFQHIVIVRSNTKT